MLRFFFAAFKSTNRQRPNLSDYLSINKKNQKDENIYNNNWPEHL